MASTTHERALVANAIRHNHDPEAIAAARHRLRLAVAEQYMTRLRDEEGFTPEQRSNLAVILLTPAAAG
jgi:hypothetical protein